jgi:energy-converting hydrogenase A subunit M
MPAIPSSRTNSVADGTFVGLSLPTQDKLLTRRQEGGELISAGCQEGRRGFCYLVGVVGLIKKGVQAEELLQSGVADVLLAGRVQYGSNMSNGRKS